MTYEIVPGVTYIGVDDHDLRFFENQYRVPQGVSYNSYLVEGEKIAVVDTSDARMGAQWLDNLSEALAGRKPDYLVIEHMEPDHSGLIQSFVDMYPESTIVISATGAKMLPLYLSSMPESVEIKPVKEGDTLDLGGLSMKFVMAPMVHWPEVMMVYVPQRELLFSADAFGSFGTLDCQSGEWTDNARRYYINIVGKYGAQVQNVLKKLSGMDISVICPLHGPVLRESLSQKFALYNIWSSYKPEEPGILIASASIHGNTREAADYLAKKLSSLGVDKVVVADLNRDDMSEAVANAFRFPKMVLCASTYDTGVFTPMHNFLHVLQAKGFRDRTVALVENGSWAPAAAKVMASMLGEMKDVDILPETVTLRGKVKPADFDNLDNLAGLLVK